MLACHDNVMRSRLNVAEGELALEDSISVAIPVAVSLAVSVATFVPFCYARAPFDSRKPLDEMQELRDNKTCCAMYVTIVIAVVASAMGVGCQQIRETWSVPFTSQPPAYKQAYGPTPRQRTEALKQLAERAKQLTPDELLTTGAELTETLKNERDPHIRRAIVQTLGALPGNSADEALHQALNDPVATVRGAACEAWATRPNANQVLPLLNERLAMDRDPDVRMAAIRAMSRFESPQTVLLLTGALDDPDPALKMTAIESLRQVSGQDFGSDVEAWRQFAAKQQVTSGQQTHPVATPDDALSFVHES